MRYQLKLFVMVSLLLAACSQAVEQVDVVTEAPPPIITATEDVPEHTPIIDDSVPVIVMLGDSLTAGYGLQAGEALPEQLEIVLRRQGLKTHFINAGVSGDTTAGGLARYDWSVASVEPDLLIVALGANDYLAGIPAEEAKTNIAAILERAKADALGVLLLGIKPRGKDGSDPQAEAFVALYSELANEFGVTAYPSMLEGIRDRPDLLQADRLHPTADGVSIMAVNLAEFLEPIISELESDTDN